MAVVKEYMEGNTKIVIHDDAYINRSKAYIQRTIDRIRAINREIYLSIHAKEIPAARAEGGSI
jgi:hypothetical protein